MAKKRRDTVSMRQLYRQVIERSHCVDCHSTKALEFDHVRGAKVAKLSDFHKFPTLAAFVDELDKCDVRCVACHRAKTRERHVQLVEQWEAEVRQWQRTRMCPLCHKRMDAAEFVDRTMQKQGHERLRFAKNCRKCRDSRLRDARTAAIRQLYDAWRQDNRQCSACLEVAAPGGMDADHIDASTKHKPVGKRMCNLSNFRAWRDLDLEVYVAELAKCQPLCVPCHRSKRARSPDVTN